MLYLERVTVQGVVSSPLLSLILIQQELVLAENTMIY